MPVDKKKLLGLLTELEKMQNDYKGKPMPEDVGAKFDALAQEAKTMQDEADAEKKQQERETSVKNFRQFAREVPDPMLPGGEPEDEAKSNGRPKGRIAGYITAGELFANSEVLETFVKARFPRMDSQGVIMKNLLPIPGHTPIQRGLIPLNAEEVKAISERYAAMESKALTVIGSGVIEPMRVDRFVQDTRPDVLTIRDVINVSPTSAPVVEYVVEVSYGESAGIVSEGATKPEATAEYEVRRANVVTIAVWIPVTEQQLQDAPVIINRVNNRLLWDIKKAEEQEIGYGDGTGEHFTGLFDPGTGISAMRTVGGDTLIDIIRRGITDVRTDGYEPNALWIHPIDWEEIELLKGSDGHYVWAIIRDLIGPRVWGLRVVEGVGTQIAGGTTRNMAVGDWRNGATLYDRQQSAISIGWINDQFIKNMRTIRAEERVAFAVEAVKAFRIHETAA